MSERDAGPARTPKKAALGRGLGSLLGGSFNSEPTVEVAPPVAISQPVELASIAATSPIPAPPVTPNSANMAPAAPKIPPEARIWQIDIEKIHPNEDQPRKHFEAEALRSLSASIREKGILQPIVVRKRDDASFEIIAGERRWRAAQLAGLHRVPVILKNTDDQNALELALIENIQRKDLNVIEEAEAYKFLMEEYDLTQQELADRVGKDRASVANILRLLQLAPDVRQMVIQDEISLGQAKVILALTDPVLQRRAALKVRGDRLTVRATEKLVAKLKSAGNGVAAEEPETVATGRMQIPAVEQEIQKLLGTKVTIDYSQGKGRIAIQFYSDDEFNGIVERLRRAWQK